MKKTLEQQIEHLTAQHNLAEQAASKLGNIKHLSRVDDYSGKAYIWGDIQTFEQFKTVLKEYPPTDQSITVGNDKTVIDTPYRVDMINPAAPNQYNNFSIKISYQSNDTDISMKFAASLFEPFLQIGRRTVDSSERHYFVGLSDSKFYNLQVRCYNFKAPQINWYGGGRTLKDAEEIHAIINHIIN